MLLMMTSREREVSAFELLGPSETTATSRASESKRAGRSDQDGPQSEPLAERIPRQPSISDSNTTRASHSAAAAEQPAQRETPVPAKVRRYAERIFNRYDTDGDSRLQPHEFSKMRGEPALADLDGDSLITPDEYAGYVAEFGRQRSLRLMPFAPTVFVRPERSLTDQGRVARGQTPVDSDGAPGIDPAAETAADEQSKKRRSRRFFVAEARLPGGLPEWFLDQDANGDGQVTMSEFAGQWTVTEAAEFRALDLNADGLITPREYVAAKSAAPVDEQSEAEPMPEPE